MALMGIKLVPSLAHKQRNQTSSSGCLYNVINPASLWHAVHTLVAGNTCMEHSLFYDCPLVTPAHRYQEGLG